MLSSERTARDQRILSIGLGPGPRQGHPRRLWSFPRGPMYLYGGGQSDLGDWLKMIGHSRHWQVWRGSLRGASWRHLDAHFDVRGIMSTGWIRWGGDNCPLRRPAPSDDGADADPDAMHQRRAEVT